MERSLSQCVLHHAGRPTHSPCRCHQNRGRKQPSSRKRTGSSYPEEKEMISRNPPANVDDYAATALKLYLQLPETPSKASSNDRRTAEILCARGISLAAIESALLLGTVRRLSRSHDMPPLSPIRSLAYFLPVIEEILCNPVPDDYLRYLRKKVELLRGKGRTFKRY